MKRIVFILVFMLALGASNMIFAKDGGGKMKLRILGSIGYSLIGNDVDETYGAGATTFFERSQLNYGFGVQILSMVSENASVGIEIGYQHYFSETFSDPLGLVGPPAGPHPLSGTGGSATFVPTTEWGVNTLNVMIIADLNLTKMFFLQVGFGMAAGADEDFGGARPVVMVGFGAEIEATSSISIPVMLRTFALQDIDPAGSGFHTVVPLMLTAGVSVKL
ncbi:MAG: hypothetical protein OEZ36_02760 [Spirochaetota bacterium]|nr:hypothetical protein [Spirochaetota bacterium]